MSLGKIMLGLRSVLLCRGPSWTRGLCRHALREHPDQVKKLRVAGLLTGVALLLAACSSTSPAVSPKPSGSRPSPATISVTYVSGLQNGGYLVEGIHQGYFKAQGLTVHLVEVASAPLEVDAVQSGSAQFLSLGPGADLFPMKGLVKYLFADGVSLTDSVVGNKSDGVTTPASLKGKKVLVPFGTTGQLILIEALQQAGLKLSDVVQLNTTPDELVSGFDGNSAPVVAAWAPLTTEILNTDHSAVTIASDYTFYPKTVLPLGWGVSPTYAATHPSVVKRFIIAMLESATYVKEHLSATAVLTAQMTHVSLPLLTQTEHMAVYFSATQIARNYASRLEEKWLLRENQLFIQGGLLPSMVAFTKYNGGQAIPAACAAAVGCHA